MILDTKMNKYIADLHISDPACDFLISQAHENDVPIVTKEVAEFLKVLILSGNFKKICELGCGYGHSTFSIASVMDEKATFCSVDSSTGSIGFVEKELDSRKNKASSEEQSRKLDNIKMFHETAISFLTKAKKKGDKFDFFFVDAVKKEYQEYFNLIMDVTVSRAVIVFDNILWKGGVAAENPTGKAVPLVEFNKFFMRDKRVQSAILPVGDGIAIGVKK
jgi:caffeoyl-CoA O-methyltransferase